MVGNTGELHILYNVHDVSGYPRSQDCRAYSVQPRMLQIWYSGFVYCSMKTMNQNVLKSHPNRLCQILPSSTPLAVEFSAAQITII